MRLGISLTTYQRKDGKTPFFLRRAMDSVFAQEHQDFKLFVVGDNYEDRDEFQSIMDSYKDKRLYYKNLDKSVEREKYANDRVLYWNNAGITAMNTASDMAMKAKLSYVCHLDHDDYWLRRHLKVISDCITQTKASWVCTKSTWGRGYLPVHDWNETIIPFLPFTAGVINSSTCYNHRLVPLRYRDAWEALGHVYPSDADLWERLKPYFEEHGLLGYFINELSCIHDEEGYLLSA